MSHSSSRGGPVTRGTLHEARAQIALMTGDDLAARAHLAHVKRWFLPTGNPVLISRSERLQREIATGIFDAGPRDAQDGGPSSCVELVRATLRDCLTAKDRAAGALDLLLEETDAAAGYLFACEGSELSLLCQRGSEPPPAGLRERIHTELEGAANADRDTSSIATRVDGRAVRPAPASEYRVIVLADRKRSGRRAIAAAAVMESQGSTRTPRPMLLAALAELLAEATTTSHRNDGA